MRRALACCLLLALAGCGAKERARALAPVKLTLTAPADNSSTQSDDVQVRGEVTPPDARVLVAGAEAEVRHGRFTETVALTPGANVIDVQAGAPQRPAAMAALRVVRLVPVEIPELEGLEPEQAVAALEALGLNAELRDVGGLLDELLPGDERVCGSDPEEGDEVRVGSTVTVLVAEGC